MKKKLRSVMIIFAVLAMLTTCAFATDGYSDEKTKTVKGYTYTYWSIISNNTPERMFAQTSVTAKEDTVPVGYFGCQARQYSSSGVLKASSDWDYNKWEDAPGSAAYVLIDDITSGYYYSKGQARFYTGDGYDTYTCAATPNYATTKSISSNMEVTVQRNENGEIYGSELFLDEIGVQPDLILAEGTNGKVGYVRADDINDAEITTPEQAAEKKLSSKSREIPLYDSDGTTIIGSFSLHPSGDIELGQLEP